MSFLGRILGDAAIRVITNPDVQKVILDIAKRLLDDIVVDKLLPLIPAAVTSAQNAFARAIPGLPSIPDLSHAANEVREDLNRIIPDLDTGIKPLDDLLDSWRPR